MNTKELMAYLLINCEQTQDMIAKRLGVTQAAVSKMFKTGSVSKKLALRMEQEYNVSSGWLLTGQGEMILHDNKMFYTKDAAMIDDKVALLEDNIVSLKDNIAVLKEHNALLKKQVALLEERVADLQRQAMLFPTQKNNARSKATDVHNTHPLLG